LGLLAPRFCVLYQILVFFSIKIRWMLEKGMVLRPEAG